MWIAWLIVACSQSPCEEGLDARLDELTEMEADRRAKGAARAVVESCVVPDYVSGPLRERILAPPTRQGTVGARLATDRVDIWNAVCPGGVRAISAMGRTGNAGALWAPCDVQRLGVFDSQAELASVDAPIVPIITAHFLLDEGLPKAQTRRAVRLIAGVPLEGEAAPTAEEEPAEISAEEAPAPEATPGAEPGAEAPSDAE